MLVLHLLIDVRDAMGANTVNTMAEAVAPKMSRLAAKMLNFESNLIESR
jgi:hydroxymethylglutaryl-CoA reductase